VNLTWIDWSIVAVVFASGMIVEDLDSESYALPASPVKVYYGASDTAVGLAVTTVAALLEAATESDIPPSV
jgi:predicted GH43/DUF377 family glycosyl hydrolase